MDMNYEKPFLFSGKIYIRLEIRDGYTTICSKKGNGMSSKVDSVGQSPGKNHININQWDDVDQQIGDILRGLNASNCGFHVVRKIISPKPSHLDWKVWGMVGIAHVPR